MRTNLVPRVIEAQLSNPKVDEWFKKTEIGKTKDFVKKSDGGLYF